MRHLLMVAALVASVVACSGGEASAFGRRCRGKAVQPCPVPVCAAYGPIQIYGSTQGEREAELYQRFSAAGGHYINSGPLSTTVQADLQAEAYRPDIVRWGAERGILILPHQVHTGHLTVENWHYEVIFGRRVRVDEPNTFIGYAGWRP